MPKPKDSSEAYTEAKTTGQSSSTDPAHGDAVARGLNEYRNNRLAQAQQQVDVLKSAGAGVNAAFDSKRNAAIGEGCGFIVVNIIPVVFSVLAIGTAVFQSALFLGLVDEAPQFADTMDLAAYPSWLGVTFVGIAIGAFFLRKGLRGKAGWLITVAFLGWLFLVPPSDAISKARDKRLFGKQGIALDAAVTELSGCLYSDEYLKSQGKVSFGCEGLVGELDSLLRVTSPEVISQYCNTRAARSEAVDGGTWREPLAMTELCSK